MEENEGRTVSEPEMSFRMVSDRVSLQVKAPDMDPPLVEISGYDLRIRVNYALIKSLDDVDSTAAAVGDLFKQMILEDLLGKKNI